MKIPSLILKQLYTFGSLENVRGGARFVLKNRLSDATLNGVRHIKVDGEEVPLDKTVMEIGDKETVKASEISEESPVQFPLRKSVGIKVPLAKLEKGKHDISLAFSAEPFGELQFKVRDAIAEKRDERVVVPYDKENNYATRVIRKRQRFVEKHTGARPKHLFKYSIDPKATEGNIENFTGVAQVPIGFAGPLNVKGEHAQGEFLVPLATTEGTLVASYNRGIKVLNLSGGVLCTVSDDCMQRAPVFVFDSAREARDFRGWVQDNLPKIAEKAEETSSIAKLLYIDTFLASFLATRRFLNGRRTSGAILLGGCALGGFLSQPIFLHALAGCAAWLALELWRRADGWRAYAEELVRALFPALVASVASYFLLLRGMVLGGGIDVGLAESLTRTLAYAAGGAPFGPLAAAFALAWLALLAAAGTALWRNRRGEAVCHLVAIVLSPALLLLWARPGPLPVRWFLVGVAFGYLVVAHGLARLWSRGAGYRGLAVGLTALFALGNGVHLASFLRDGRGSPHEAVRFLADASQGGRIEIGGDHDFRNPILLRYYARQLPAGSQIEHVPRSQRWRTPPSRERMRYSIS